MLASKFPNTPQLKKEILSYCFHSPNSTLSPRKHSYSCLQEPSLSIYRWLSCSERSPCLANINDREVSPVGVCFGRDIPLYSETQSHCFTVDRFSRIVIELHIISHILVLSVAGCLLCEPYSPQENKFTDSLSVIFSRLLPYFFHFYLKAFHS